MTKKQRERVTREIESVYQEWHLCALNAREAKAMGLKEGRLCDGCRDGVKARTKALFAERAE